MREKRELFRVCIAREGTARRGAETAPCEIIEITPQGIGLKTALPAAAGDMLTVEFKLSGAHGIRCAIQVTHATPPELGGRITDIAPEHQRRLDQFIDQHAAVSLIVC
jgi:hypothetical protein